jgi:transcriptional regulator with XRE-family HTH domain
VPERLIVGQRIREERKRRNLTLQELAKQVGLSVPYLSQIENGRVNINIGNLESIGKALDVPIINFFVNGPLPEISLVRQGERRWFALGELVAESLLIKSGSNLEICVIRLKPHSSTLQDNSHQGEEFSYVIKGQVRMILDEHPPFDLNEGDMIYYRSEITHRWQNLGDCDAEVLVVNTPATY